MTCFLIYSKSSRDLVTESGDQNRSLDRSKFLTTPGRSANVWQFVGLHQLTSSRKFFSVLLSLNIYIRMKWRRPCYPSPIRPSRPDYSNDSKRYQKSGHSRSQETGNMGQVNSKIASCGLKDEFIRVFWTYGLHIRSEARWANSQLKYKFNLL